MASARPRTLSSAGFIQQLVSLKQAPRVVQEKLRAIAVRVKQEAIDRTPSFDPEMAAGWTLIENGAIGTDRYNVTVINNSPRATEPLSYDDEPYLNGAKEMYTLLDIYDTGVSHNWEIGPKNKGALSFFWRNRGRKWRSREGQVVTHKPLPAYHTISEPKRIGEQLANELRVYARGYFRSVLRGKRKY
jgi:hypothetical protein